LFFENHFLPAQASPPTDLDSNDRIARRPSALSRLHVKDALSTRAGRLASLAAAAPSFHFKGVWTVDLEQKSLEFAGLTGKGLRYLKCFIQLPYQSTPDSQPQYLACAPSSPGTTTTTYHHHLVSLLSSFHTRPLARCARISGHLSPHSLCTSAPSRFSSRGAGVYPGLISLRHFTPPSPSHPYFLTRGLPEPDPESFTSLRPTQSLILKVRTRPFVQHLPEPTPLHRTSTFSFRKPPQVYITIRYKTIESVSTLRRRVDRRVRFHPQLTQHVCITTNYAVRQAAS